MSRRIKNFYLYAVKVGSRADPAWLADCGQLEMLLAQNMKPAARKRYPRAPTEQITLLATAMGMDRVRSCSMFFVAPAMEGFLLKDANRLLPHAHALPDDAHHPRQEDLPVLPVRFRVLLDLIAFSHRAWSYIVLTMARDTRPGWKGRLAAVYLGPDRQASFAHDTQAFETVVEDLGNALDRGADPSPDDPVDRLLDMVSELPTPDPTDDTWSSGVELARKVLATVKSLRPPTGYRTPRLPHLAAALNDVVERLGTPSAPTAASGAAEISLWRNGRETDLRHVLAVLDRLPADHRRIERPPGDVLRDLAALPTPPLDEPEEEAPLGDRLPRDQLLAVLGGKLRLGSPHWAVFVSLQLDHGLEAARNRLHGWLPGPKDMLPPQVNWLERAVEVLADWKKLLACLSPPPAGEREFEFPVACLELPEVLHSSADAVEQLDAAIGLVMDWINVPASAPPSWLGPVGAGVPVPEEPVIRAALFTVFMMDLIDDLKLVYNAHRSAPAGFAESILGARWRESRERPQPDEVDRRLRRLADAE